MNSPFHLLPDVLLANVPACSVVCRTKCPFLVFQLEKRVFLNGLRDRLNATQDERMSQNQAREQGAITQAKIQRPSSSSPALQIALPSDHERSPGGRREISAASSHTTHSLWHDPDLEGNL